MVQNLHISKEGQVDWPAYEDYMRTKLYDAQVFDPDTHSRSSLYHPTVAPPPTGSLDEFAPPTKTPTQSKEPWPRGINRSGSDFSEQFSNIDFA